MPKQKMNKWTNEHPIFRLMMLLLSSYFFSIQLNYVELAVEKFLRYIIVKSSRMIFIICTVDWFLVLLFVIRVCFFSSLVLLWCSQKYHTRTRTQTHTNQLINCFLLLCTVVKIYLVHRFGFSKCITSNKCEWKLFVMIFEQN